MNKEIDKQPTVGIGMVKSIVDVEFIKHITKHGKILRWCSVFLDNGFVYTSKPSIFHNTEDDNKEIGEKQAIENVYNNLKSDGQFRIAEMFKEKLKETK